MRDLLFKREKCPNHVVVDGDMPEGPANGVD